VAEWAAEQGYSYFGALKTSTKCTPYQELIDKMSDYPSGSYLVMECSTPVDNYELICIGYKYSARKVLVFLGTKNAGSTRLGEPYIARFPDSNGNVAQRIVPRPDIIGKYFGDSNVIDSHNQARQGELQLEKRWVVQEGWFRIDTTLIAMTVTDCWRAFKHAMPQKKNKELPIKEFADRLAYDCIHNPHSDVVSFNGYLQIEDEIPRTVGGAQDDISTVTTPTATTASSTTAALSLTTIMSCHPFKNNPELEPIKDGKTRPIRRRCKAVGCNKLTPKMCFERSCLEYSYSAPGGVVFGIFYCPEHYCVHYDNILTGKNKGI
jgi:hypothetical protein